MAALMCEAAFLAKPGAVPSSPVRVPLNKQTRPGENRLVPSCRIPLLGRHRRTERNRNRACRGLRPLPGIEPPVRDQQTSDHRDRGVADAVFGGRRQLRSALRPNCWIRARRVDARDRLGARPLSHAARSGHLEMVDLLLARGAPIDARNLAGATALYFAAEGGHAPIVQRLIERGADVNLTGRSGVSPVAAAAYAGSDTIVEALLARGADGRMPDDTGKPPMVYAAAGGAARHREAVAGAQYRYQRPLCQRSYPADVGVGPGREGPGGAGDQGRLLSAGCRRADRRSGCARAAPR